MTDFTDVGISHELKLQSADVQELGNDDIIKGTWWFEDGKWEPQGIDRGPVYAMFRKGTDQDPDGYLNLFEIISTSTNAPLLVTDQGFIVKKDISAGGFVGSNQGELWLGSGRNDQVDVPKIVLGNSSVSRLQGGGPLDVPPIPSDNEFPAGENGQLFIYTPTSSLYKHNGSTWIYLGPTSNYAGYFDTLYIRKANAQDPAHLDLGDLTAHGDVYVNDLSPIPEQDWIDVHSKLRINGDLQLVNGHVVSSLNPSGSVALGSPTEPWAGVVATTTYTNNLAPISPATTINLSGVLSCSGVVHGGGSSGDAFKVGDDIYLVDVNEANTVCLQGAQTRTNAKIYFGSDKDTNLYRSAQDVLKTEDNFDALSLKIDGTEVINSDRAIKDTFILPANVDVRTSVLGRFENYLTYADKQFDVTVSANPTSGSTAYMFSTSPEASARWNSGISFPVVITIDFGTNVHYWKVFGINFIYSRLATNVKIEVYRSDIEDWETLLDVNNNTSQQVYVNAYRNWVQQIRYTISGINAGQTEIAIEELFGINYHYRGQGWVDRGGDTMWGQLKLADTGSSGGLRIGGDVSLYRDSAYTLRLQNNLIVEQNLWANTIATDNFSVGSGGDIVCNSVLGTSGTAGIKIGTSGTTELSLARDSTYTYITSHFKHLKISSGNSKNIYIDPATTGGGYIYIVDPSAILPLHANNVNIGTNISYFGSMWANYLRYHTNCQQFDTLDDLGLVKNYKSKKVDEVDVIDLEESLPFLLDEDGFKCPEKISGFLLGCVKQLVLRIEAMEAKLQEAKAN